MKEDLKNCWEILKCEREQNGGKVFELGECIASKENLGHSCWMIAGTLCGGIMQGTVAQKEQNCMKCEVYKLYHRQVGSKGSMIKENFPDEEKKYCAILLKRFRKS